jgi:hypothetical protein
LTVFPAPIAELGVSGKGAVMASTLENVTEKEPEPSAEQLAAEELVRPGPGSRACR